jgi:hypothetical protein
MTPVKTETNGDKTSRPRARPFIGLSSEKRLSKVSLAGVHASELLCSQTLWIKNVRIMPELVGLDRSPEQMVGKFGQEGKNAPGF